MLTDVNNSLIWKCIKVRWYFINIFYLVQYVILYFAKSSFSVLSA